MPPLLIASRRRGSVRCIVGWSLNVDGQLSSCSLSATSFSARTAVSDCDRERQRRRRASSGSRVGRAASFFISCRSPASCRRCALSSALHVVFGDDALAHEPRAAHLARRGMRADDLVHHRLRERRLVGLVVALAAIAHEVDQEVLANRCAIRDREPHGLHARLGVVGVDVHDRHLEALRQIARVVRRARVDRIGGEADLVVAR